MADSPEAADGTARPSTPLVPIFLALVALTLMGKAGLVGAQGLRANRKYAVVGVLVAAALFTPPDVFSMMVLFTAVYGLYEISILLVQQVEKKREEKLRAEGYSYDEDDDEETDE